MSEKAVVINLDKYKGGVIFDSEGVKIEMKKFQKPSDLGWQDKHVNVTSNLINEETRLTLGVLIASYFFDYVFTSNHT